ncbi:MAG: LacI family transcriptional regulator [Opitutaceae bacterium]|jgi:LacI family transcriptional regulator|nr:LacI family transcriptional regulator [Opitutaceae bacterium]
MPSPDIPTTREIALASGFSQSAVSHALRGTRNIAPGTRRHILAVARGMGWRTNPFASAYMAQLRRQRRKQTYQASLAFLLSNPASGRLSDQLPHVQKHYKGAVERAGELGYGVELVWLHEPHLSARRLADILRSRNIPGLLVPGVVEPVALFEKFDWKNFASVAMGFTPSKSRLHRVTVDTSAGFSLVLKNLRKLGYRKIGIAVSRDYDRQVNHGVYFPVYYAREWWREDCCIEICDFTAPDESAIPGIQDWLRNYRPEVVLGEDITWQAIRRMGWQVPRDVAFATVDWSEDYARIAGLNQRHELHGSVAVDLLVSQVSQNEMGLPKVPRVILLPGEWSPGPSAPSP